MAKSTLTKADVESIGEVISTSLTEAVTKVIVPALQPSGGSSIHDSNDSGIDNDDPVIAAGDDAEVALIKDIQANGVKVYVSRDRRGNVTKTNMHGVAYDMIQRIKNNRKTGNNRVY